MTKLLILADDLTGAMDTAVQFAKVGIRVRMGMDTASLLAESRDADVLAVNTETRHSTPEEAYRKVLREASIGKRAGIPYLYKKTDSALRGNVGAELSAALEAWQVSCLPFVPAYPAMNRTTKDGIHSIDGVPVARSAFGKDAYTPVLCSDVAALLRTQCALHVIQHGEKPPESPYLEVFDAQTEQDILRIADMLQERDTRVMAGCAGLAAELPTALRFAVGTPQNVNAPEGLLVLCGSTHPAAKAQIAYAAENGFTHVRLSPALKLGLEEGEAERCAVIRDVLNQCRQGIPVIIDANDAGCETMEFAQANAISTAQVRNAVARALGKIGMELVAAGIDSTLLITGGDTLMGFLSAAGACSLQPVAEILPGVALAWLETGKGRVHVISKAGSFGDNRLLATVAQTLISGGAQPE